jgi:hypothetical protein
MSLNSELITMYGLLVSPSDYESIKAFCEDYKLGEVIDRSLMQVELASAYGYYQPLLQDGNTIYLMDDIEIVVADKVEGEGNILMIVGNSPAIEALSQETIYGFGDDVEVITEEPVLAIPLAHVSDFSESELQDLSFKLRDYLNDDRLTFFEMKTRYLSEDEYKGVMDGEVV